LRDLLLAHENAILYVSGHTHHNRIASYVTGSGAGFWQVTTASIIDWPQQSRTLELMDNHDGTLSIFATTVSMASGLVAPSIGMKVAAYDHAEVIEVARTLTRGDVEWRQGPGVGAAGRVVSGVNIDSNVELILRDPRR